MHWILQQHHPIVYCIYQNIITSPVLIARLLFKNVLCRYYRVVLAIVVSGTPENIGMARCYSIDSLLQMPPRQINKMDL